MPARQDLKRRLKIPDDRPPPPEPGTRVQAEAAFRSAGGRWSTDGTRYAATDGDVVPGNNIPGIQTGGRTADGSSDTRCIWEKAEDAVTGDRYDDKTGRRVA